MSLINEALKRARDGNYHKPAEPNTAPAYRPVSTSETGTSRANLKHVIAIAVGCGMAAIAVTSYLALRRAAIAKDADATTVLSAPNAEPPPPPVAKRVEEPAPAAVAPLTVASAQPAPELPKLVLQGITGQGNVYEAMINGYTVHEGEEIEGARVLVIEARRVKLEFAGREFVLRLP
jgi:hypothetical protein